MSGDDVLPQSGVGPPPGGGSAPRDPAPDGPAPGGPSESGTHQDSQDQRTGDRKDSVTGTSPWRGVQFNSVSRRRLTW